MTLVPDGTTGSTPVVVTSLEMRDPGALRAAAPPPLAVALVQSEPPDPALSQALYREVGGPWSWVDRVGWTAQQWRSWVTRSGHELWTCTVDGSTAGYFELSPEDGSVEIAYFGLLAAYVGRGIGGWLLTGAIRRAWALPETRRVWVHTCSLDGPGALPNYLARGLVVYARTVEHRLVPVPPAP